MTINTGAKRVLGASTVLGSDQFLGQGDTNTAADVEWELLFSTDDAAVSIPSWTFLADMRGFSVEPWPRQRAVRRRRRHRRDHAGQPGEGVRPGERSGPFYPNLRPMNRVWLRMRFNGVTRDIFKGYVESYEQQFPEFGLDAVTIVKAVDEFKPLAPGTSRTPTRRGTPTRTWWRSTTHRVLADEQRHGHVRGAGDRGPGVHGFPARPA